MLTVWFYWDIDQAEKNSWSLFKSFKPLSAFNAVTPATTKVAIVRSDDPELSNPTPITDDAINYDQIIITDR